MLIFRRFYDLMKPHTFTRFLVGLVTEFVIAVIFTLIYTYTCDREEDFSGKLHHGRNMENIFENFYFSTVTMFGVGFGDIYAISVRARIITLANIFVSITLLWSLF